MNGAQPAAAAAASVHQADSICSVHLLCQRTPDKTRPSVASWCGAYAEMWDSSSPTAMATMAICSIGNFGKTNESQDKVSVLVDFCQLLRQILTQICSTNVICATVGCAAMIWWLYYWCSICWQSGCSVFTRGAIHIGILRLHRCCNGQLCRHSNNMHASDCQFWPEYGGCD